MATKVSKKNDGRPCVLFYFAEKCIFNIFHGMARRLIKGKFRPMDFFL